MTFEEKIEFLRSYKTAKENVYSFAKQISELEEMQLPAGVHYSDLPKHPNYDDKMATFGGQYWELTERMKRSEKRMVRVTAVINQIAEDDPDGHQLLTEQYIKCYPRHVIENNLGIARETRRRWHNRAVNSLKI